MNKFTAIITIISVLFNVVTEGAPACSSTFIYNVLTGNSTPSPPNPLNVQCVDIKAKVGLTIDGSSVQVSIPTPPGAVSFTGSFYVMEGLCSALVPVTAAGASTYTPYPAANAATSSISGSTTNYPFSTSKSLTLPPGGKACLCLGASYGLDGTSGYAQGAGTRQAFFATDPVEVYQYGAFTTTSATTWTIVPGWLGRVQFTYLYHTPQVKFVYPGVGDSFTGFYPQYVLPNVNVAKTVDVIVQRLTDPLQDNFNNYTTSVKVSTYQGPGAGTPGVDFDAVSQVVSWNPGETANRTVTLNLLSRASYSGSVIVYLTLSSAQGSCIRDGTSSTPLRIISRGCSEGPTCGGQGTCSVANYTIGPMCVCNSGYTPSQDYGTCVPSLPSVSNTPSGPSPSPFPTAVPSPVVEWIYRAISYSLVPDRTYDASLIAVSTQKSADTDGTSASITVNADFFTGKPVTFSTSVTRTSTGKKLSFTPALIVEFIDANLNGYVDSGEVAQVARIGLDSVSNFAGGVTPFVTNWTMNSYGPSGGQSVMGSIDGQNAYLANYRFGFHPSWSSDQTSANPPTQMTLELRVSKIPKKSPSGSFAIIAVVACDTTVTMKDVPADIADSRGPVKQLVAGDAGIRIPGVYSQYGSNTTKVVQQYPMSTIDSKITDALTTMGITYNSLASFAFEQSVIYYHQNN